MDRNTITGFLLIFGVMLLWTQLSAPTEEQIAEQRLQDSLAQVVTTPGAIPAAAAQTPTTYVPDTSAQGVALANSTFGAFAPSGSTTLIRLRRMFNTSSKMRLPIGKSSMKIQIM